MTYKGDIVLTEQDSNVTFDDVTAGSPKSNQVVISGSGSGNNVQIVGSGTDTDIDVSIIPKGSGGVDIGDPIASDAISKIQAQGSVADISLQLIPKGSGDVSIGDPLNTSSISTIEAIGTNSDVDLQMVPKGAGLVITSSGYDMSAGPDYALATKQYVDNKLISSKTSAYTTVLNDQVILGDSAGGAFAITLGSASVANGKTITIKDSGGLSSTNNITIITEASELIDGMTSTVLSTNYNSLTFISDGTNWFTI